MTLFLQANGWTVLLMKIKAKFMLFCREFNHQGNALYKKIDTDMSLSIFSVVTNYLPNHQEDKKEDEKGECGPLTRN